MRSDSPLIRQVLSTVDAARSTNCYVCMYDKIKMSHSAIHQNYVQSNYREID